MLCSCGSSSDITSLKTLGLDLSDDVFDCRKGRVSETRTDIFLGRGHKKSLKKRADFFFWGRRGRSYFLIFVGTWICFLCCVCVLLKVCTMGVIAIFHHQHLGELTFHRRPKCKSLGITLKSDDGIT